MAGSFASQCSVAELQHKRLRHFTSVLKRAVNHEAIKAVEHRFSKVLAMATRPVEAIDPALSVGRPSGLSDPRFAIGGPRFDALFFWGAPLIALLCVQVWLRLSLTLSEAASSAMAVGLVLFSAILTYAHLVAVVPRAYLNPDVFMANRLKLTIVPVLLLTGLFVSPALLAIGGAVAIFWDIHHSAMQNFGLSRIYDMKAGNDAETLRKTDLRLNWVLYVGPLAAGASLMIHLHALDRLDGIGLGWLARLPGVLSGHVSLISGVAIAAWVGTISWTVLDYRKAIANGYKIPAHKLALVGSTGLVSLVAWGFSSPLIALVSINIYHAVQYFALVWLKEGQRMTIFSRKTPRATFLAFCAACVVVGVLYQLATKADIKGLMAPFIACSLLHFWYDSFVWSVRKKQV